MAEGGVLRYIRGLFKDTSQIDQPRGTVRFARNAVMNRTKGAIANESGNVKIDEFAVGGIVIGKITTTDDIMILFLKIGVRSEIGMLKDGVYRVLYNPAPSVDGWDLNFSTAHPIEARFKLQGDGDLMVYWTDDYNPPRVLNITRQLQSNTNELYGRLASNSPDTRFIDQLNLFPHAGPVPHISLVDVFMGGGLKTGVYYLALGYTSEDLTTTNYVSLANPVSIVDEVEGVNPIESYDGAPPGILTGKSITWRLDNINTDQKYVSVAIIQRIGGVDTAVKLNDVEINNRSNFNVTYTGEEGYSTFSAEEVVIDTVEYTTAKTMEQLDNVLYLGNLTSKIDVGYQKYANLIKACAVTKTFPDFDPFIPSNDNLERKVGGSSHISDGYRDVKNIYDFKGYTREEVYALYIAFILKSGQMTYAYHIPGREHMEDVLVSSIDEEVRLQSGLNPGSTYVNENGIFYDGNCPAEDWDIIGLTGTSNPQGHLFQWYDFSHLHPSGMNYWKNLHEFYPNTEDFDVCDAENPTAVLPSLREQNVRHHRFPSNRNAEFTTVKSSNATELSTNSQTKAVVHWYWFGGVGDTPNQWTLRGAFPNDDAQGAEDFQDGISAIPMGGRPDPNVNNYPSTYGTHIYSCDPRNNTRLHAHINDLGCNPDLPLEWRYDTAIPVGARAFIAYEPPQLGHNGGNLIGLAPQCGFAGIGDVIDTNGSDARLGNMSWFDTVRDDAWTGNPGNVNFAGNDEPGNGWEPRPGWVAWVECEEILTESDAVTHEVQALGFCLEDLKIPKDIADQIQGFRLYYADRKHENRTVLGQAPVHPMEERKDMDISNCDSGGINTGLIDYLLPTGLPGVTNPAYPWTYDTFSFHDFYLLNRTPNLANATHLRLQYIMGMFNWKGPTRYYYDAQNTDTNATPEIYSCWKPEVRTSFHMSGNHYRIQGPTQRLNYLLKDKAKSYILGNTIYEGATDGFEKSIYNIGGETHIALRTKSWLPWLVSAENAPWRDLRSDHADPSFVSYTDNSYEPDADKNGLQLYMTNLKAFKSDVYNTMDVQDLVWTGYEVLGDDLRRFVVDEDGNPLSSAPNRFKTDEVYGGDTYICRYGYRMTHREEVNSIGNPNVGSVDNKSVIFTLVESTENINFRHMENLNVPYFPGAPLADVLKVKADVDLTYNPDLETGNIKYNEDYSAVNNLKKVLPLPYQLVQPTSYPTRVIRSAKTTSSSLIDNYRIFEADQVRELNNNKGELWKIIAMNSLLLFHMEDTLYQTKGKQKMQTSNGGEAFIGQGDIFSQEPDEVRQTDGGYLGTRSQWSSIVTPYGYFSIDSLNSRIFYLGQGIQDLTGDKYGMEDWFRLNMPSDLTAFGYDERYDNPIEDLGFHSVWDERYSRMIITKKDLRPTEWFIEIWKGAYSTLVQADNENQDGIVWVDGNYYYSDGGDWNVLPISIDSFRADNRQLFQRSGWTISFALGATQDGKIGAWESVHDYMPYQYGHVGIDVYSFNRGQDTVTDRGIYKHNYDDAMGVFYGNRYPFEVEVIHNEQNPIDKLYSSLELLTDVYTYDPATKRHKKDLHAGFTEFMLYNSDGNSGISKLEYMINIRKVGGAWKLNKFRDISAEVVDTSAYYTGPFVGGNFGVQGTNVAGTVNTGTPTSIPADMFVVDGMYEPLNPGYIDNAKPWNQQSKFVDRFLGLRLIADNVDSKLINLYTTTASYRPYHR